MFVTVSFARPKNSIEFSCPYNREQTDNSIMMTRATLHAVKLMAQIFNFCFHIFFHLIYIQYTAVMRQHSLWYQCNLQNSFGYSDIILQNLRKKPNCVTKETFNYYFGLYKSLSYPIFIFTFLTGVNCNFISILLCGNIGVSEGITKTIGQLDCIPFPRCHQSH